MEGLQPSGAASDLLSETQPKARPQKAAGPARKSHFNAGRLAGRALGDNLAGGTGEAAGGAAAGGEAAAVAPELMDLAPLLLLA